MAKCTQAQIDEFRRQENIKKQQMAFQAVACKIKELIMDVDEELKCADRLHIELQGMDYDLSTIYTMQHELHEKCKKKSKKIGANIC